MLNKLTVFQKGLILIVASLLFQLALIGLFLRLQNNIAQHQALVTQSVRIAHQTEDVFRLVDAAQSGMRSFLITHDRSYIKAYEDAVKALPGQISVLRGLVLEPDQLRLIARIANKSSTFLRFLAVYDDELSTPGKRDWSGTVRRGQQLAEDLRAEIDAFIRGQESVSAERYARLGRSLEHGHWAVAIGAGLSVLLAAAMLYLFRTTIASRLARLAHSAQRLAEGRELIAAPMEGDDEIARVDKAFRDTAQILAERTAALTASNLELQNFASVASHDLQEPLRKIEAFGERLKTKNAAMLNDQGRDYLLRILDSAARMRRLINDLLAFSRITTRAQPFTRVDLNEIARDVVSDLEARVEDTQGRIDLDELPVVDADPLQMRQLLQNLIANGLKFHKIGEPSHVIVQSRMLDGQPEPGVEANGQSLPAAQCEISVQDNGIGFEETYLDRIFEVFQRLHGRSEYEGTGIGLAICRKIVERHGGQITARSAPGAGATFIVTLPLTQANGATADA